MFSTLLLSNRFVCLSRLEAKQEIALLMGSLHVVSGNSPTTKRSAVPTIAQTVQRTSAIRVRISSQYDMFLSAIRARQTAAVRAWVTSKLKHHIIDCWYFRRLNGEWHVNARIAINDVKPVMSQSCPAIQTDAPRDVRLPFKPVWLRRNGKQMDASEAEVFVTIPGLLEFHHSYMRKSNRILDTALFRCTGSAICPHTLLMRTSLTLWKQLTGRGKSCPNLVGFGREALNFWSDLIPLLLLRPLSILDGKEELSDLSPRRENLCRGKEPLLLMQMQSLSNFQ